MFTIIFSTLCVFLFVLITRIKKAHKYWTRKGVNGPKPKLFYGNFKTFFKKEDSIITLAEKVYNQYQNEKIVGLIAGLQPVLLVRDVDLAKKILVKDFSIFCDKGLKLNTKPNDTILISEDGEKGKILRQKLSPLFSKNKLEQMMPLLNKCAKDYMTYLDVLEENVPREIKILNTKYSVKAITSVAFGIDINTFSETRSPFIEIAEVIAKPKTGFLRMAFLIEAHFPGLFYKFSDLLEFFVKDIISFFLNLVKQIVKEREGKPKVRKDLMDLMIDLKEKGSVSGCKEGGMELEITDKLITAQAFMFYAAGYETTSSSMSFMLYELAFNQNIQDHCYKEIKNVMDKCNGEFTFEALYELKYVSMAFDEALRKYPIFGTLMRQSVADYEIPELNVTIEKGTKVLISVLGLHHDPKYFPDPEKYDPERFSAERIGNIRSGSYLPFGDGPRNCIGLRLGKVQAILGIANLLYKYRVRICEKTVKKIRYDPRVIGLRSIDGIWLNIEKRI